MRIEPNTVGLKGLNVIFFFFVSFSELRHFFRLDLSSMPFLVGDSMPVEMLLLTQLFSFCNQYDLSLLMSELSCEWRFLFWVIFAMQLCFQSRFIFYRNMCNCPCQLLSSLWQRLDLAIAKHVPFFEVTEPSNSYTKPLMFVISLEVGCPLLVRLINCFLHRNFKMLFCTLPHCSIDILRLSDGLYYFAF